MIPFTYESVEYDGCTLVKPVGDKPWCGTAVSGNQLFWDDCNMDVCKSRKFHFIILFIIEYFQCKPILSVLERMDKLASSHSSTKDRPLMSALNMM